MDINDLKKAWNQFSSEEEGKNKLDEGQIKALLGKHTKNVIEKIDRNIKIGFLILFLLIVFIVVYDVIASPKILDNLHEGLTIPKWLFYVDFISNFIIALTFVLFVIKYYRVKKRCDITCDLKNTLIQIIKTLQVFQRQFYFAVVVIMLSMATGFVAGMYIGFMYKANENGISISELDTQNLLFPILLGTVVLLVLSAITFLLLRWGFRRLYGKYLKKLQVTLKELQEID